MSVYMDIKSMVTHKQISYHMSYKTGTFSH